MRHRFDGAFEAILEIIPIGLDYLVLISTVPFWGTALLGGILAGLVIEAVWLRWR